MKIIPSKIREDPHPVPGQSVVENRKQEIRIHRCGMTRGSLENGMSMVRCCLQWRIAILLSVSLSEFYEWDAWKLG